MRYDVYGEIPGRYRPARLDPQAWRDPGRVHLRPRQRLPRARPGESANDPYKATPDELYARGKAQYDAGRLDAASAPLEELFNAYTLRDDVAKDAARMLLLINIKQYNARKVVQYFEVVKEKAPELVITFDDLLVIGRSRIAISTNLSASRDQFDKASPRPATWKTPASAKFASRGKSLEGMTRTLLDLCREYPNVRRRSRATSSASPRSSPATPRKRSPTPSSAASSPTPE